MRLGLLLSIAIAVSAQAEDWRAVVDKPANEIVKEGKYATVVVGVLDKDHEQVFSFGEWEGKAPDRDSIYEIGSITKVFTGILLADRVKSGVVKLDDPVQKHLPDGWTMRDITLLHLATHTSGLPKMSNGFLAVAIAHPEDPFAHFDEAALRKGLPETKLLSAIGARQEYSNVGVGLLGHALAHASTAENYKALLTERVLKPLGLDDTAITLSGAQKKRVIPGHTAKGKQQQNWNFATCAACGALKSTVGDLLKFVKVNADPPGPLKDALEMAQQNWRDVRPGEEECGLCWIRYVGKNKKDPTRIWHNGQTGGHHSFVGFVPGRGGVVVLCNVTTFDVDKVGFAVLNKLAEAK
jgi:CubicO group peptidase (beta-lactamase class C family)